VGLAEYWGGVKENVAAGGEGGGTISRNLKTNDRMRQSGVCVTLTGVPRNARCIRQKKENLSYILKSRRSEAIERQRTCVWKKNLTMVEGFFTLSASVQKFKIKNTPTTDTVEKNSKDHDIVETTTGGPVSQGYSRKRALLQPET